MDDINDPERPIKQMHLVTDHGDPVPKGAAVVLTDADGNTVRLAPDAASLEINGHKIGRTYSGKGLLSGIIERIHEQEEIPIEINLGKKTPPPPPTRDPLDQTDEGFRRRMLTRRMIENGLPTDKPPQKSIIPSIDLNPPLHQFEMYVEGQMVLQNYRRVALEPVEEED